MKLAAFTAAALLSLGLSTAAHAAQPASSGGSASAKVGSSGAKASSSGSGSGGGYDWPDFVYGGNSVSIMLPFQIGIVGYQPRVRIGLQYDRQLYKRHWVHLGVASLLDRGSHDTFKESPCGRESVAGDRICEPGTVAGFDAWLGYNYKFYLEEHPYVVPSVRLGVGGGFWKYPRITGALQQNRDLTWSLSGRLGSGLRIFLTRDLAVGLDLNFAVGFGRHRDKPPGMALEKRADFLLGLEILPAAEYRF